MNTDKTLADVQPGGMVRLGDQAERVRFEAWALRECLTLHRYADGSGKYSYDRTDSAWKAWQYLSAQPSPGGQGEVCIPLPSPGNGEWSDGWNACREAMLRSEGEATAARQPVGEAVDDYDSAFQEPDHAPYLVDAAGYYALQSFLTVAEEFRRSAEPHIEAINEGACAGEDEVSQAFDTQLARAKEAVSRSVVYTAPHAQAVDLGAVRDVFRRWHANELNSTDAMLALVEALAVIDSQAVGNGN